MEEHEFEVDEMCPYIERLGVCMEPAACFLNHQIKQTLNTAASEFRP